MGFNEVRWRDVRRLLEDATSDLEHLAQDPETSRFELVVAMEVLTSLQRFLAWLTG